MIEKEHEIYLNCFNERNSLEFSIKKLKENTTNCVNQTLEGKNKSMTDNLNICLEKFDELVNYFF